MPEFLNRLNENAGALSLLFSAVVMVSTAVYAWLTARLVDETRRLRQAQTEPRIEVSFRSSEHWINFLDISIKNIGLGPAYDLSFKLSAQTSSGATTELIQSLEKHAAFKRGMAFLAPDREFVSFWTSLVEGSPDKTDCRFVVHCTYKDTLGKKYTNECILNLSELEGSSTIGELPLHAIAKSLAALSKDIHSTLGGLHRRLQVDTHSQSDRDSDEERLSEHLTKKRGSSEP